MDIDYNKELQKLLLYIKSMESKFLESMYMLKYNLFGVLCINFVIESGRKKILVCAEYINPFFPKQKVVVQL